MKVGVRENVRTDETREKGCWLRGGGGGDDAIKKGEEGCWWCQGG